MTIGGTASATAVLFVLLLISAVVGWNATTPAPDGEGIQFPLWTLIGVLVGFGCVIAAYVKPHLAKFLAPIYALAEGVFVGAISKAYETQWNGIVVQAAGRHDRRVRRDALPVPHPHPQGHRPHAAHRHRRHARPDGLLPGVDRHPAVRPQRAVLRQADCGSASCSASAWSAWRRSTWRSTSTSSSGHRRAALPKQMEWVCALGLMVTIVWLYLEILRLLSKLQSSLTR